MGLTGFHLVSSFLFLSLTNAQDCCHKKVVSEPAENAGTYLLVKFDEEKDSNCVDACIYIKFGSADEKYCFKAVDKDPATIDEQCEDPMIAIKRLNKEIEEESEKIDTASSATTTVDRIDNALALGTKKKRQSDSDIKLIQCTDFGKKFEDLGKPSLKNKTKYFRLRLSDKVGTESPETDLRLT